MIVPCTLPRISLPCALRTLLYASIFVTPCAGFIATTANPSTGTSSCRTKSCSAASPLTMFNSPVQHEHHSFVASSYRCGEAAVRWLGLQRRQKGGGKRVGERLLMAPSPPDDFIDTTITEVEDSYVGVDFERQELRVIFENMDKNNVFYKMLSEDQITEILTMVQTLLRVRQMPVDISKLREGEAITGKWKLEFSTEERYKLLPPTTDVYNYIYDDKDGGRLDNVIRFYKSWVLKSVRAVTKYTMDRKGRIVFEFDRIEADLCGLKVPLPKFSQDAGFVEVQYFDGDLWIEVFEGSQASDSGQMAAEVNIYRRVGDATDADKTRIPERTGGIGQAQR